MAGDIIPKQINCVVCNKQFSFTKKKETCSYNCYRSNYKQKTIKQCLYCQQNFNADRGAHIFCSRSCGVRSYKESFNFKLNLEVDSLKRISKKKTTVLHSINVLKEISALIRIGRAKQKKDYQSIESGKKSKRTCVSCGKQFVFIVYKGCPPKYCKYCKAKAYKEIERKGDRISKAKRRARVKGLPTEQIDPIDIFKRDNWICHICKKKTNKKLRGTYNLNAPELDHIITISEGGGHLKDNVACACRDCNQKKGGKSFGQLFLFGG
jgi:hypothetical protein